VAYPSLRLLKPRRVGHICFPGSREQTPRRDRRK
jgi:hypothetical protein